MKIYFYDHLPSLKELMPSTGGVPGIEYLMVSTTNLRRAQDEGWLRSSGSEQRVFTLEGPAGRVDCELYSRG